MNVNYQQFMQTPEKSFVTLDGVVTEVKGTELKVYQSGKNQGQQYSITKIKLQLDGGNITVRCIDFKPTAGQRVCLDGQVAIYQNVRYADWAKPSHGSPAMSKTPQNAPNTTPDETQHYIIRQTALKAMAAIAAAEIRQGGGFDEDAFLNRCEKMAEYVLHGLSDGANPEYDPSGTPPDDDLRF